MRVLRGLLLFVALPMFLGFDVRTEMLSHPRPETVSLQSSAEMREAFKMALLNPASSSNQGGRSEPAPCRGIPRIVNPTSMTTNSTAKLYDADGNAVPLSSTLEQNDPKRFTASNITAYCLIGWANGMASNETLNTLTGWTNGKDCDSMNNLYHLSGAPDWIRSDGFDVQALLPDGSPSYTTLQLMKGNASKLQVMIQALLADRFKLVLHKERKGLFEVFVIDHVEKPTPN